MRMLYLTTIIMLLLYSNVFYGPNQLTETFYMITIIALFHFLLLCVIRL